MRDSLVRVHVRDLGPHLTIGIIGGVPSCGMSGSMTLMQCYGRMAATCGIIASVIIDAIPLRS